MYTASLTMNWLFDQLSGKLVDLVITILVIERLLTWRDRRKWRRVRPIVNSRLEAAMGDYLRAWSRWFAALQQDGVTITPSRQAMRTFEQLGMPDGPILPDEDFEQFLLASAGEIVPEHDEAALLEVTQPLAFQIQMRAYLIGRSLAHDHPAWTTLTTELGPLIDTMSTLIERIPTKRTSTTRLIACS